MQLARSSYVYRDWRSCRTFLSSATLMCNLYAVEGAHKWTPGRDRLTLEHLRIVWRNCVRVGEWGDRMDSRNAYDWRVSVRSLTFGIVCAPPYKLSSHSHSEKRSKLEYNRVFKGELLRCNELSVGALCAVALICLFAAYGEDTQHKRRFPLIILIISFSLF